MHDKSAVERGQQVARWVVDVASRRDTAEFELLDLRDYPLPAVDTALPPVGRQPEFRTAEWVARHWT